MFTPIAAVLASQQAAAVAVMPPPQPQQPHALHPKDLQALGAYPAIYQRHSINLAVQQAREEELRR